MMIDVVDPLNPVDLLVVIKTMATPTMRDASSTGVLTVNTKKKRYNLFNFLCYLYKTNGFVNICGDDNF